MNKISKQTYIVILAFALPLFLIAGVFVSIYIDRLNPPTQYNFLHATCKNSTYSDYTYNCPKYLSSRLIVVNQQLTKQTLSPTFDSDNNGKPDITESLEEQIFLHDTKNNQDREITFEEAQQYKLSKLLTSPDGASIKYETSYTNGGLFVPSANSSGLYLINQNNRMKLNLIFSTNTYPYDGSRFYFLGWILQ